MSKTRTILLVEDEAPAVFAIERYFLNAGYNVLKTFSAQEGLKTALESHPDAIILDIIMPVSNGLDILPELRSDPWGKDAKVIVFSNLSSDEYKAQARKFNVINYFVKTDTSLKDLVDSVNQILPDNV